MATIVDLFVDQGSDHTSTLIAKDSTSTVINLTGYTVETYFQKWAGSSKVHKFTSTVTSANTGAIQIKLLGSVSDDIASGRYTYDVVVRDSANDISVRVQEGTLVMRPTASPKGATLLETGNKLLLES